MYAPQALFCRFSVFAGGATLEAVGALNGDTPDEHGDSDALEGLAVLPDHSLLDRTDEAAGAPRYRPLAEESLSIWRELGITMEAFDTAWAEGAVLSLEQAIAATLASV